MGCSNSAKVIVTIDDKRKRLDSDQVEGKDKPTKVINSNPVEETFDRSQHHLEFPPPVKAISENVPTGGHPYSAPSRSTRTPQESSLSVASPGNITTLHFIPPKPTQHKVSMERRIAAKIREIKLPRDEKISNVTDTAQLEDGSIVMSDQKNKKLLLLNKKFQVLRQVKLSGCPHNITDVPETTGQIAVTIPEENVIKIVDVHVFGDVEKGEIRLNSKHSCYGIDCVDGDLLFTRKNDVAVLRKDNTTRVMPFEHAFRRPVSLSADRRNNVIYVSCYGLKNFAGEVVKMHYKDKRVDFKISCNEIKRPICSTIDRDGYIYICDTNPPSIHQVSPDGTYCQRLLDASKGNFQHVSFIEGTDMFIATLNDSDTVHIYKMA